MLRASICLTILIALGPMVSAQIVPTGFSIENVVSTNLGSPNDFEILPDGRFLIAERTGEIKMKRPSLAGVFTIGTVPNVLFNHDVRGLLSIVVKGDKLYTWASKSNSSFMVLSRFTLTGNLNDPTDTSLSFSPGSEYIVLESVPDNSVFHNGGTVRFGPDGMLYLSAGDDGDCAIGADANLFGGSIMRLDVGNLPASGPTPPLAALVPADNPWANDSNAHKRLIIASGMRNPFSMCIDGPTGDLFIGDVGEQSRDELNHIPRNLGAPMVGHSYGWPWYQGTLASAVCLGAGPDPGGHVFPIDERVYGVDGNTIICAGVTRNVGGTKDFGPSYEFNVFHNAFYAGKMKRLAPGPTPGSWVSPAPVPGQPDPIFWGTGFHGAMHFDLGPDGAIYFLNRGFLTTPPSLRRIAGSGQVYNLVLLDGNDQVCASGETFGRPIKVRVTDMNGIPVPNVELTFTSSDNSASFANIGNITDSQGIVTMPVTSTGMGQGTVSVKVSLLGAISLDLDLFARKLELNYSPGQTTDTLVVDFFNTSNAQVPVLPILLALTLDVEPVYQTIIGDLYVDLITLQNTFVIEDGGGSFGAVNYGPVPPYGTPSWSSVYTAPSGFFGGLTYRFQMFVVDPTVIVSEQGAAGTTIGRTNPVSITY